MVHSQTGEQLQLGQRACGRMTTEAKGWSSWPSTGIRGSEVRDGGGRAGRDRPQGRHGKRDEKEATIRAGELRTGAWLL